MSRAVIVVGAVGELRRHLERHVGERASLLILRLAIRRKVVELEPYVLNAIQMVEKAADSATALTDVLIISLPYARCPKELSDTIQALEGLGATVRRPSPNTGRWPSRPQDFDVQFREALYEALEREIDEWVPGDPPPEAAAIGVARAQEDFGATLLIPQDVQIVTTQDGHFWYRVLRALHDLCILERQGLQKTKREVLAHCLQERIRLPRQTYKVADTDVFTTHPGTGQRVHLRERVHLISGKPTETESVYWITIGETQPEYRYLIGKIGRHA
jgi:hypothetical protein